MGPYDGHQAHGGLDIDMPAETVLYAPLTFDDQYFFNSLAAGTASGGEKTHPVGSSKATI